MRRREDEITGPILGDAIAQHKDFVRVVDTNQFIGAREKLESKLNALASEGFTEITAATGGFIVISKPLSILRYARRESNPPEVAKNPNP